MIKGVFGARETAVPSAFCPGLRYEEGPVRYDLSRIAFRTTARGCLLELPLEEEEQIYGLGLQLKSFNHRGKKLTLRVNADPAAPTGDSHAPVPFFVSTKGYGVYLDTARYIEVYAGVRRRGDSRGRAGDGRVRTSTDELYAAREEAGPSVLLVEIPAAKGVTLYLMEGKTITEVVSQYNRLAGGGCSVPAWGLGPLYRCYSRLTGGQVHRQARYFRERDIPCSILGLEPGWQSQTYSCSFTWDAERFPDPDGLIRRLREDGFHVNLWEHAFTHPSSPLYEAMRRGGGDYEVWNGAVPDFASGAVREAFAGYHRERFVERGVDGFKLDECDGSDYTGGWSFPNGSQFPSGLDGEQMHGLFGTLYMQTMLQALDGVPTLSQVRSAGALAAPYPFVLYSDLYDHRDFIRGCASAGFSGLLWAPELRHAVSRGDLLRRLQTAVFSVQCVINAWYCEEPPWLAFGCEDEVRDLLKARERLVPLLLEAFEDYRRTGKPPVRALVSDYTDDPATYEIDDQYLLGDLVVAPMTAEQTERSVYLPEGRWRDWWTGRRVESGRFTAAGDRIPVYERIPERPAACSAAE